MIKQITIAIIISSLLLALWWLSSNQVKPFISPDAHPNALNLNVIQREWQDLINEQQNLGADSSTLILTHLWNPNCLCNSVSQRHVNEVMQQFSEVELELWALTPNSTTDQQISEYKQLNPRIAHVIRQPKGSKLPLTSSPGLAISRSNGKLEYYGAYGFGVMCTPSGDNFFSNLITNIRNGAIGPFLNVAGKGCFCAWPS